MIRAATSVDHDGSSMAVRVSPDVSAIVPDIIQFVTDPQLLGLNLSPAQEVLLRAIYGLPLTPTQRDLWYLCTRREQYPACPFNEVTILAGARAGKDSRIAAPIICYEALLGGHEHQLSKGERGVIPLVAQDARATKIAFSYIRDYLTSSPILKAQVVDILSSEITLANGLSISCFPSTLRSLRGWSIPAGVLDELAFFRLEGAADSDAEIQASIRRGMLAFASTRLVKISTPYLKGGVLYDDFERAFGQDDADLLVWRAPSVLMNPSLRAERLAREQRLDPLRYRREYEAEWLDDVDAFLPAAWVDAAVVTDRRELPRRDGMRYFGTVDPSGGGADAFALEVSHVEGEGDARTLVVDALRSHRRVGQQAPDLAGVVREYAEVLRAYGLTQVLGDRYSGAWVQQAFAEAGIHYVASQTDKSQAYLALQPWFATGRVELPDHPALARELKNLERRPRPGGRDLVDHPRGQHDDHANVLALAAVVVAQGTMPLRLLNPSVPDSELSKAEAKERDKQQAREAAEQLQRIIQRDGCYWPESGGGNMGDGWR